jgi:hypothetical protein
VWLAVALGVRLTKEDSVKPEIASLHERMKLGGDWRAFREEIAALHAQANTEEEYVTLLYAHQLLVEVGKSAFDEQTYAKLLPITAAEYRMFLNKEATEGGLVNPVLLERITRREVTAGRLESSDDFRTFAASAATALGDSAEATAHRCRHGDSFFYGAAAAVICSVALVSIGISPLWLIAVGLVVGWFLNERERKHIRVSIEAQRQRKAHEA